MDCATGACCDLAMEELDVASTVQGSVPASSSSASTPRAVDAEEEEAAAVQALTPTLAPAFTFRPSVGTWLQLRAAERLPEEVMPPFQRFLRLHCPFWVDLENEGGTTALCCEPDRGYPEEAEEWAVNPDVYRTIEQHEALEHQVSGVVTSLRALTRSFGELQDEDAAVHFQYSEAKSEQRRLRERVLRLRGILQRNQGEAAVSPPEDLVEGGTGSAGWARSGFGSAENSLKLLKRSQILCNLPTMLQRAQCFDQDEDGLGTAPISELAEEAAELSAFCEKAQAEYRALEGELFELRHANSTVQEENEKLLERIAHLRTCVANAKHKAAAGKKAEASYVAPARAAKAARAGGC
mmetsp:Transcript_91999/g.213818  ORF Transcript_91999/g.213818 Transcript_91999/m.213818 type:complete len:353 (+) Transcript_91999:45-1103(+)